MAQKCQKEVEEPRTASQHHENPSPACCCVRGRWRRRHRGSRWGLLPGVRPWQGLHAFAFDGKGLVQPSALALGPFDLAPCIDSINPALGIVDVALGLSSSRCPIQPCVGSIEDPLGRSTPLWTFQPGIGLAAYAGAGSWEPGTWDTNYLTPAELPRLRVPVLACTRTNECQAPA